MDVQDLFTELNAHGFEDTDDSIKMNVINETVWDVAGREAWPQLEKAIDLNFSGSSTVPSNVPADLRAVISLGFAGRKQKVTFGRLDDIMESYGDRLTEGGDPRKFFFQGGQLNVWPQPAASTALLRMRYLYRTAELATDSVSADIWIPKQYHRGVVLNGALYKLYVMEDDPELAREFERLYEKGFQNMRNDLWTQQFDTDYIHIVDEDDLHDDSW